MESKFLESGALITTDGCNLRIGWGKKTWKKQKDSSFSFYFPDFFLKDETPWLHQENTEKITIDQLIDRLRNSPQESPSAEWVLSHEEHFQNQFNAFMQGSLIKAVPYVFAYAQSEMTEAKLNHCLIHLLEYAKKNPVYVYGFWEKERGVLGATPEILFELEDQEISTIALAGTAEEASSLLEDSKQRKEHQTVIEGILHSLKPFGKVVVGKTTLLSLPHLIHLATPIQLKSQAGFEALTAALHPTPALGTFPKAEGKQWLEKYQALVPRERFGAPVGYTQHNKGRCYVAIRNVQWKKQQLQMGAGCGIVKESILEKEWKELILKIKATRAMLAM